MTNGGRCKTFLYKSNVSGSPFTVSIQLKGMASLSSQISNLRQAIASTEESWDDSQAIEAINEQFASWNDLVAYADDSKGTTRLEGEVEKCRRIQSESEAEVSMLRELDADGNADRGIGHSWTLWNLVYATSPLKLERGYKAY